MATTRQNFLASHRDDASRLVERAKKFSVRIPVVGKVPVPPPEQLAFYGALGILAAASVIDWPVAVAIGVGAAVVAHDVNARPVAPTEKSSGSTSQAHVAAPRSVAKQEAKKPPARKTVAPKATRGKEAKSAST